jgi:5-methylcytosine-specific restriction endonuclease McrA
MRSLTKTSPPAVLAEKRDNWTKALMENPTGVSRLRYRHREIKQALLEETFGKCVYCESKIGHNCPGDIEHKAPKSKCPLLTFEWANMTIACSECNRRKGEYYDPDQPLLDPYEPGVERRLRHLGPLVFQTPGDRCSERTVRLLELDELEPRKELVARKIERLDQIRNLIERITAEPEGALRRSLAADLEAMCYAEAEYSGMVLAYVEGLPAGWSGPRAETAQT